jgi:hypothetical protein
MGRLIGLITLLLAPIWIHAQALEDVSGQVGVQNFFFSTNLAWGDYNNDGQWDLYITNWGGGFLLDALYANDGDGFFFDDTQGSGLAPFLFNSVSTAAAWGDYDNDGDVDLYVASFSEQDYLFENQGGGFSEYGRSQQQVNLFTPGSVTSIAWADYNNDGYLDIYLGKYYFNNEVHQNNGDADGDGVADGSFSHANDLGISDGRDTDEVLWADYDNDGDVDLYIVNREQENTLYRNELAEGGTFRDIACALSVGNKEIGQGGAWADYDNDGDMDLYLASVGANALYRNDGNENFVDVTLEAGVSGVDFGIWMSAAAAWADHDGDGFLDLYVANGGDRQQQPDLLYAANGDGTFRDASFEAGFSETFDAHMAVGWADFNGDGAPDLHVTDGFAAGNLTWRNTIPAENFIRVRLAGKGPENGGSNLNAIGAQVRLVDTNGGALVATRQLLSRPNAPELIFGAPGGPYDVEVLFPSGIVAVERGVSGGDLVTVVEP